MRRALTSAGLLLVLSMAILLPACAVSEFRGEGNPGVVHPTRPDPGDGDPAPGVDPGDGEPVPEEDPDTAVAVAEFQERCEQGVEEWRDGQVDYPRDLPVTVGGANTYNAAIDIRSTPLPPDEVIDTDGRATSEAVLVKCTVAARLIAVGDSIGIAEHGSENFEGWIAQEFTPTGVVEWSWTVTATKPVDQQLRLELRPAIVLGDQDGDRQYASNSVTSFITDVRVEASLLQHTAYWFEVNWPPIVAIATAVGAGTVALIKWIPKLRGQRKVTATTAADPSEDG